MYFTRSVATPYVVHELGEEVETGFSFFSQATNRRRSGISGVMQLTYFLTHAGLMGAMKRMV
jgi:hypothetical protein